MNDTSSINDGTASVYRNLLLAVTAWTLAIVVSLIWNIKLQRDASVNLAKGEAAANIGKDFAFRHWATGHGGVYVPVNPKTGTYPNPYLNVPERDIQTPSGRRLTLMNPAYMVRQMQQTESSLYGVKGRITSLKPLNPGNAPDAWETSALQAFERGAKEVTEVTEVNGKPYLRAMRPFVTEQGCLKCHDHQGYKVGDVRGGVGAYVPMDAYLAAEREAAGILSLTHGGIWLLGLVGLGFVTRRNLALAGERRVYINALRESEARVRLLLDSTAEGILGVDHAAQCTFCNRAALKMLGYPTEQELIGKSIHATIYHTKSDNNPNPPDECRPLAVLRTGEDFTLFDELLWRADGSSFPADLSSHPMRLNGAIVGAVISFHDISERKQAEQVLAKKTQELEHSNAELEQFAYVASHDLQEPLRMVSSYTQLLARRYKGKLDQDADDFIAYAVDGATRMQRLINDLLTFSRIGSRGTPFEAVDAGRVLQDVLEDMQVAIEESGAVITHDELPTVQADPTQLHQLLLNLLGNAIKFRSAQKPVIHIGVRSQNDEWRFSVHDNGIGIAPEFFERIFVIFQRLHSREDYPGTGIGLAVCKRIVERHHGHIWVESKPGQGSTFWFTMPLQRQAE